MPDSQLICEHCLADNELRAEIEARGTPVLRCAMCGHENGRALPSGDSRVKRIFRALVRLRFSEPEYNTHLGGETLQTLVRTSRLIFDLGPDASEECFEDAFLVLEEDWYPKNADGISLGGGYWDGGVLWGLREQRSHAADQVMRDALAKNVSAAEAAARALLTTLRPYVSQAIPSGSVFVRGRLGVKQRLKRQTWLAFRHTPLFSYLPYTDGEIGAPPEVVAGAGRLNREHVSIMYVASDTPTAVAELRPHPGHLVSTASFRLKREITIANLATHDIRDYLDDEKLEVLRAILSLADVLNVPVQPDQRHMYEVTQLLADVIQSEGFEGVSFRSSVGPGVNLACFDAAAFELIDGSSEAYEVAELTYSVEKLDIQPPGYDSSQFEPDTTDPLATLVHSMSRRVDRH